MPKETYIPHLLRLFRQHGYDGATLAKISEATGLGKASLYHHFPGGKDEMVETVLDYLAGWMEQNIVQPLQSPGDPVARLRSMGERLKDVYEGGRQPCLSAIVLMGSARDLFHQRVQTLYQVWITAIAAVLTEMGQAPSLAQERATDAVIAIQGALIVAQGLNDPTPFQRVIKELPEKLCHSSPTPS